MQPMQWARTLEVLKFSTLKSHQSNQCYAGRREEEQKRTQQMNPQDLNPNNFPSLRGEIDWWKGGSRSSLSFPKIGARIIGGIER